MRERGGDIGQQPRQNGQAVATSPSGWLDAGPDGRVANGSSKNQSVLCRAAEPVPKVGRASERERECQEDRIRLVNTFHVFTGRRFAFICPFDEFEEVQSATKFFRIYRVLRFQGRHDALAG